MMLIMANSSINGNAQWPAEETVQNATLLRVAVQPARPRQQLIKSSQY